MRQLIQEGVRQHLSLFSLYICPKPLYPFSPTQPEVCHAHGAESGHPSSVRPYPQSWVQVESSVEQLIIIVVLVFPLADNLVDGRSKANESCAGGGGGGRGADSKTPSVP